MEQQTHLKPLLQGSIPNDYELLQLIQSTYLSKNTSEIQSAEAKLTQLLTVEKFIDKLVQFLQTDEILNAQRTQQFKVAVSILIKKFSYQLSKKQQVNKQNFVQKLFCLIISKLNQKSKEQLGTALEYILNNDLNYFYRPKVISKVEQLLMNESEHLILEGSIIVSMACLNSLIEAQDQFNFIWRLLPNLMKNAVNIIQYLKRQSVETLGSIQNKKIIKLSKRIFDFLELGFSRLLDEEDFLQQKMDQIRQNPSLHQLLYSYLANFNNNKSMLSIFPEINSVKEIIVEIIFGLYLSKPMPQNIFNLFFLTIVLEAEKEDYSEEEDHIITRSLELMETYLQNKFFYQYFEDHKMQILLALMTYSVTKPEQFDLLQDQPERFIQIAEEYTEGFRGSTKIRVRAASFIRTFASKFDEALRNIIQIVVIIVTANMQADEPTSPCLQLYANLKEHYGDVSFFKYNVSLQLQTCFNILSLLSNFINKREDLNKVVYALLITHHEKFQKIENKIVLLRLIRMIGYYPTAVYYPFIKLKMSIGRIFVLEGLKSFERILKLNRYPEIFEMLAEIFSQIINVFGINDSIFESIVLNHYERVLKKNLKLYKSFLMKIRDTFIQNLQKSQHSSFLCLQYIYSMLNKQNEINFKGMLVECFYAMEQYYHKATDFYRLKIQNQQNQDQTNNKKVLKNMTNYEQKILDIYCIIIKKEIYVNEKIIDFALKELKKISSYSKNSQIFRLYNNLFLKIDYDEKLIKTFYNSLMQEIRDIFSSFLNGVEGNESTLTYTQKLQILPNLCYLVSQLFGCFSSELQLQKSDVVWIIRIAGELTQDVKQYLFLIILSYAYIRPFQLKDMLVSEKIYQTALQYLLRTNYNEKLIRKIFLLAMTKLLEIQEVYFEDIIRECIKYFKQQFNKNEAKPRKKQYMDPKLRRLFQYVQKQDEEEEGMMEQKRKEEPQTCLPQFKHPFSALSQYDQFKIRIWQNIGIAEKLSEQDKNQLRQILQMDWFGKGVRKIIHIKLPN